MKNIYLIDSNVIVYAYDVTSQFHDISEEIINYALNGRLYSAICDKNLFEFYAVVTIPKRVMNPIQPDEACSIISILLNSKIKIYNSDIETIQITLDLLRKHQIKSQKVFDIAISGIMIKNKIKNIITFNDKDFVKIKEINVINPLVTKLIYD